MQAQELTFNVDGLQFAAQAWGNPEHYPILALHGWLDNSASFFALAPLLNNVYIVALDMAGHGQTSHRLGSFPYNIWEDVAEIFAIADQLGWKEFGLLGHSRGAIIATLCAGTFPERISRLGLIEGLLPEPTRSEDTPVQLARSIQGIKAQSVKALSLYPDVVTAIKARERGMFPLSYAAAKALTERGLKKVEKGYHWSTDQRLLAPSAVKLLPEQMAAFVARATCPIALVLADEGMPKLFPKYSESVDAYPQVFVTRLPGGHHLHMEKEVTKVAAVLNSFFDKRD
ncbi:hydrolase [Cellvibrio zantedeschiae]|uniref:Hydrolase n=1 Tax=Cellvibrio zantedeschiae TaxID=1237077 RepID=A0ABQ3AYR3_9GAMM|nr:alpha/beta hydrolase [Cellvibrio zantedeschiae]GGY71073.1 hydrolase [Cellvibrio zantedeschiae]